MDFLIIGGAKCATTWSQRSLQQSPGVAMPDPELHYFSRFYDLGAKWYAEQFPMAAPGVLVGDKSNSYLTHPEAAGRIKSDLPDVKLIVQMRDPVERAYSDYCMLYRRGEVSAHIEDHLDPARNADQRFLADGLYGRHLSRFLDLFPADRFLFLLFEDIDADPAGQFARLAAHIGLEESSDMPLESKIKDKHEPVVPLTLRKALTPFRPVLDPFRDTLPVQAIRQAVAKPIEHPPLTSSLRQALRAHYSDDVEYLKEITRIDVMPWERGEKQDVAV